jgi:hypothetical protein
MLNGGVVGGLDSWVHLIQANIVFGLIECGGRRVRSRGHGHRERAFNWNNCPAGQNWVARGSIGGQLFDRYFEPGQVWLNSPTIFR